ncbi:MAG: glycosyltransferase involved in cell wall biosynthesis [Ancylomarina sp.]|jgi:glycosyltransferase involved in cell wall biosynthesis
MEKRILLLIPYGGVGGMERLALTFYNRMKKLGYNVKVVKLIKLETDIILFGDDEIYLSKKDFSEMSFIKRLLFYLSIPFKFRRIINKYKITDSIGYGDMCNLFSSLSFTKENKIASIHALKSIELINKSPLNRIYEWAYKNTYRRFNKVVCISEAIKDDLIKKCGYGFPDNLKVIYNPHDVGYIQGLSTENVMSESEEQIFKKNDVVVFLGRYSEQKAPWHLIRSFALVADKNPNSHLVFIGSGDKGIYDDLIRLVEKYKINNKVSFFGQKSNPYPYLKAAKVLALSSYYEGTPNVIIESIALETPIVSTSCTKGIWELMCVDWENDFKELIGSSCLVDSGYISPTLFRNTFSFDSNSEILNGEKLFAEAVVNTINSTSDIIENIKKHKKKLLEKYEVDFVIDKYLQ